MAEKILIFESALHRGSDADFEMVINGNFLANTNGMDQLLEVKNSEHRESR
ncbi:hypothetical protein [Weizmannia acidilactici]|uniref:hypothetical protein n=1 Tax=Weizmannia acidilactici TaxID=2607726 RepID=UPI0012704D99|nr:hypothetical protein [Weizmannia acidilactici]GER73512.1 hypothetical protein BpPP18_15790 [Weizmannia acidilactici]